MAEAERLRSVAMASRDWGCCGCGGWSGGYVGSAVVWSCGVLGSSEYGYGAGVVVGLSAWYIMGSYVPLVEDQSLDASFASSPVENREALGFESGCCSVPPFVGLGACRLSAGGTFFF